MKEKEVTKIAESASCKDCQWKGVDYQVAKKHQEKTGHNVKVIIEEKQ